MVTEKLSNLSELWVDLLWTKGSGTNPEEQFWRISIKKITIKLATFRQWAKVSREAASEGPTVIIFIFVACLTFPSSN